MPPGCLLVLGSNGPGCSAAACASPAGREPGLCASCMEDDAQWAHTWLRVLQQLRDAERRRGLSHSTCIRCHSGGMMQPVLCENAECPVLYSRLQSGGRIEVLEQSLQRLDECW